MYVLFNHGLVFSPSTVLCLFYYYLIIDTVPPLIAMGFVKAGLQYCLLAPVLLKSLRNVLECVQFN